jgi:DNA polymerase III delta prime subunit
MNTEMELPFIARFQPLYFKDFEIHNEIIVLLNTLLKMDNLNVLYIGDSGCGKTSLIRATIREYYNSDYNDANILSINTLKDQGITYYRTDVKTFCQTKSSIIGKKKIVILDDLDVINEQSQQVFRNCIDKYSHNVHFIASCTNSQKIIDSLQSRMTIIKLKALHIYHLKKIIDKICHIENILITKDVENFILSISNNSIRIIINYLEKFKLLNTKIDMHVATAICTNIAFQEFINYINYCKLDKNLIAALKIIYAISDKGYSVMDILDNFFLFVKSTPLLTEIEKYKIIQLICKYISIFHNIHENEIELALFTKNLITLFS